MQASIPPSSAACRYPRPDGADRQDERYCEFLPQHTALSAFSFASRFAHMCTWGGHLPPDAGSGLMLLRFWLLFIAGASCTLQASLLMVPGLGGALLQRVPDLTVTLGSLCRFALVFRRAPSSW